MGRKSMTTNEFINKTKIKHGDKFDYSKTEYISNNSKITIICPIHGEFNMEPRNHLRSNSGCDKCKTNIRLSNKSFILKAREIHGNKYDYSKIVYQHKKSKLIIICPEHGEFEQVARNHIMDKCGCQLCANESISKSQSLNTDEFILKSNLKHKHKYDYSNVEYINQLTKVKIICPKHGEFTQRPVEHLRGCGCQKCKESKGEKKIREYLIENKIKFISQYKFDNCRNKNPLPFDFYLPELNMCIEYNGAQHYKPIKYWGGEETLKKIKFRDKIKKKYCSNNDINLMIIRYNEKIENKLIKIKNLTN